jgi:glycosyltransferase involved in cell wall biosynthesis
MSAEFHKPKVSVCVISYNHERYIADCLESIVSQKTNFKYEIVVGDDCSSDKTQEIIDEFKKRYPSKIRTIFHPENLGDHGCGNYRAVHALARGEYIAHMDGDDLMKPGKIQLQADFLDANPKCSMVAHSAYVQHLDGTYSYRPLHNTQETAGLLELLNRHCDFTHSSTMYRSEFNKSSAVQDQPIFIDFELYVELAGHGDIGFINQPLVVYRETPNSATRGQNDRLFDWFLLTLRAYDRAIQHGIKDAYVYRAKAFYVLKSAVYFTQKGAEEMAGKCFEEYDKIPKEFRPKILDIFVGRHAESMRVHVCNAVALARTIFR